MPLYDRLSYTDEELLNIFLVWRSIPHYIGNRVTPGWCEYVHITQEQDTNWRRRISYNNPDSPWYNPNAV